MEFGILFTSHPNHATEPYPHRAVHAEHHFSNEYGIMPDVFTYLGYLAARTSRIRLGTAVVTLPLYDPVRVVENMAFVDNLSNVARWVYVAESDAEAKRDSADGIIRHLTHFLGGATAGYLGNVSEKVRTVRLELTSRLLHYPPHYGHEKAMRSLRLFAERVIPEFRAS